MELRPYQTACHAAIKASLQKGVNKQLIQMATGTGKTVVFAGLPTHLGDILPGQMMVLAHREELIDHAIKKIRRVNPTLRIDKEMAKHRADPSIADVVVASVASLGRKGTSRILNYNWERFDKFVTDEAHHSTAQSYSNIYETAGLFTPGDTRLLLGVTATPQRSDGQALAQLYQRITFAYSMRTAIEEGWLVEVRGVRITTGTSLDNVSVSGGDYKTKELSDTVNTPQRNQLIVKAWLDNAKDRQTIGFCVDIQHAKDLAEMFRHHGVAAEAIWGDDPERAEKLATHRAGDIRVLLNCGILTEGYDDWRIGCVILGRPTKSSVLFTQMVGRATRLEELEDGTTPNLLDWTGAPIKRDCIIIDVVDASSRHSLVTLPTLMGLSPRLNLHGGGLVEAVRALEAVQKDYPHIDFTQLGDITELSAFVESVNLFDVHFPPEVESASALSWYPSPTGGYVLMLPDKDRLSVSQNMLDKWEIKGNIRGKKYAGERGSIEDAFAAADDLVTKECAEALKILRREETWHSDPATPGQLKLLAKFYRGKAIPNDLDKGRASKLISSFLAGKA
jgi:superfamily II DNA or RNA helicase